MTSNKHSTLKEVHAELKKLRKQLPFGYNRFIALRSCFLPEQTDLMKAIEMFRSIWSSAVSPGSIVCFDESLWEFQPNAKTKKKFEELKDPIPVVYIPRKPHPYIFDIEPHISFPQVAPQKALENCISRWKYPYKAHIVADAAFGSLNLANYISSWGGACTLSASEKVVPHIWELLARKTGKNHWKAQKVMAIFKFPTQILGRAN